jgi:hypothetical protein
MDSQTWPTPVQGILREVKRIHHSIFSRYHSQNYPSLPSMKRHNPRGSVNNNSIHINCLFHLGCMPLTEFLSFISLHLTASIAVDFVPRQFHLYFIDIFNSEYFEFASYFKIVQACIVLHVLVLKHNYSVFVICCLFWHSNWSHKKYVGNRIISQ